jgi:hypothetical protein
MPNANSAFGLRPVRYLGGAPYNGACNTYIAPASYATNMFIGDPVVITGVAVAGTVGGAYNQVNVATAGATNQITGVIVGFEPTPGIVSLGYGAASTLRKVYVCDDPAVLFEMQEDSVGGNIALASVGLNANLVSGTGSTYTKRSGWMLDSSTVASDATFQVVVRGFSDRPENDVATDTYAKALVSINIHTSRYGAVAGI